LIETILDKAYDSLTDEDVLHLVHARLRAMCASIGEPEPLVTLVPGSPLPSANNSGHNMRGEQVQQPNTSSSNTNLNPDSGSPQPTMPTAAEEPPYAAIGNDHDLGPSVSLIAQKIVSQIKKGTNVAQVINLRMSLFQLTDFVKHPDADRPVILPAGTAWIYSCHIALEDLMYSAKLRPPVQMLNSSPV
jgi:hypothetical protein